MDETKPRRSWLLIVSLCLNVALIGAIAVVAWRIAHFDIAAGGGGPMSPRAVMAEFPDRQPAIQAVVAAHREKMAALRRAAATARRDVFRVFAAPDYTPQKMATALDAVTAADVAVEREAVGMMGESLATLSPEQRQAMVDRLKARNRSWFFRLFRRQGMRSAARRQQQATEPTLPPLSWPAHAGHPGDVGTNPADWGLLNPICAV